MFILGRTGSSLAHGLLLAAVPWLLLAGASPVVEGGLSGTRASAAAALRVSCSVALGISPDQVRKLSPAVEGRFLTTEPPGKSWAYFEGLAAVNL